MVGSAVALPGMFAAILLCTAAQAATSEIREGRSIGKGCSPAAFVCAVHKDGSMKPTDECAAKNEDAIRILPGDCYDAD